MIVGQKKNGNVILNDTLEWYPQLKHNNDYEIILHSEGLSRFF